MLIMHSDGVRSAWERDAFAQPENATPAAIAHQLLQRYGRPDDDATVVVAKNSSS
jgi:hypothetical protein